jgi:hypothetical protein
LNKPALRLQLPVEESERKPQSTTGFLSEATLTALLAAQEIAQYIERAPGANPGKVEADPEFNGCALSFSYLVR